MEGRGSLAMKRALGAGVVLLLALNCAAFQFQVPLGGSSPSSPDRKSPRVTSRTLTGSVLDKSDQPVADAVVYLKNTKTLAVKTYIAQTDGSYRFSELSNNIDYEVYAQKNGKKSNTKVLSQFDDRAQPRINLRMDVNK
jgi:Carboxypeptidase regulatory-like domain